MISNIRNLHITLTPFRNETRLIKEARSFVSSGYVSNVDILALHSVGQIEDEKFDQSIRVRRLKLRTRCIPKALPFQFLKLIELIFKILNFANSTRPDIVTVHSLSLLPVGALLKIFYKSKLVYDAHELETETFVLKGFKKSLSKIVERVFIKYVDLTMVVSDGISNWYKNEYGIDNVITIMNSPPCSIGYNSNLLRECLEIPDEKKIVLYLGGIIPGRGIEELLSLFNRIENSKYVIVFMGYGEMEDLVEKQAKVNSNIYLMHAVPPDEVLRYASSADVGIAYIDNGSLNDYYCLPNKFFEYIFSRLPVIVNNIPEMASIVKNFNIGVVLDSLDEISFFSAVDSINNRDKHEIQQNISNAITKLSWRVQEQKMLSAHQKYVVHN